MAAALQLDSEMVVGDALKLDGTGFADSHAYTIDLTLPGPAQPSITLKGTTSAGGAITGSDVATIIPGNEGILHVKANDGTSTVEGDVQVFRSV